MIKLIWILMEYEYLVKLNGDIPDGESFIWK